MDDLFCYDGSGGSTHMTDRIQTVITTDGEVDDMNSFIRALYYSNEMDIRGIVLSASMYHYAGNIKKRNCTIPLDRNTMDVQISG